MVRTRCWGWTTTPGGEGGRGRLAARFGGEALLGRPVDARVEILERLRAAVAEAGYRVEVVADEPVNVFGIGLGLGIAREEVVRAFHERARAEAPDLADPATREVAVQRLADFLADEAGIPPGHGAGGAAAGCGVL